MTEDAFLALLHIDPADEITWLALADWLEENGQGTRAELSRLLRRLRQIVPGEAHPDRSTWEARVAELLSRGVRPVVPHVVNSLGMWLVLVPPGSFVMGSPRDEPGRKPDETQHEVTITRPFYLGTFPVTQGQYEAVTGERPGTFCADGACSDRVVGLNTDELPVEWVSWHDAVEFCARLSSLPEEVEAGRVYRLPSESEWEYACRAAGTSTRAFHTGATLSSAQANFDGRYPAGESAIGPYLRRTTPEGTFPPNALGLYDLHGNVQEWCSDWHGDYEAGPAIDPQGPPEGGMRVHRGGCWDSAGPLCRSARRGSFTPGYRSGFVGFRVVAVPGEKR
jgi:uncharacterized protein (TIGR02996 family)